MILVATAATFLATALGALAVFWWAESRKEALPHRIREIAAAGRKQPDSSGGRIRGWVARFRKTRDLRRYSEDAIAAIVRGKEISGARLLLNQAGYRSLRAYRVYRGVRIGLPALLTVLLLGYGKAAGLPNGTLVLLAACGASIGFVLPALVLRMKARKRQEAITDALPDALDLLVVCVEAGLGINASFIKITEEFRLSSPPLSEEFDIVNREMVAGKPRQDALRALADRTGVEDVKSLVAMLIQTEKLGTSLAQSLRVHSDSLRTRRRQRAEEAAAKTTIKLIFPLVFFLFPALFIVILGPGFIQILRILFPAMQGG
jgi:tight adherence protein C